MVRGFRISRTVAVASATTFVDAACSRHCRLVRTDSEQRGSCSLVVARRSSLVEERFRDVSSLPDSLPRAAFNERTKRFSNPWLTQKGRDVCERPIGDVLGLMRTLVFSGASLNAPAESLLASPSQLREPMAVDWNAVREAKSASDSQVLCVWLGHASVICVCRGQLVLFDPVFSGRCSPFSFMGPKRLLSCPVDVSLADWPSDLEPDLVAISHAHYDHLDDATVRALRQRFANTKWVAPMGHGAWFHERGIELSAEMNWWDEAPELLKGNLSLVCLPAQHWSNRWPWDRNKTLWCGFGLADVDVVAIASSPPKKRSMPMLFVGDTGYCPVFKQIGSLFEVGLAAVPIGAYEPRWFMESQHCDPREAVQIVDDLGAGAALAIHWGTYPLTTETPAEQLAVLGASRNEDKRLKAIRSGGHILWRGCESPSSIGVSSKGQHCCEVHANDLVDLFTTIRLDGP